MCACMHLFTADTSSKTFIFSQMHRQQGSREKIISVILEADLTEEVLYMCIGRDTGTTQHVRKEATTFLMGEKTC